MRVCKLDNSKHDHSKFCVDCLSGGPIVKREESNRVSEDNSRGRGVSTTIKNGKGYEESWHGFTGLPDDVREDIINYFGLDRASVTGMSTFEVSIVAERIAHSAKNAVRTLGGTPVKPADQVDPAAEPAGSDPWAETSATPAQAPVEGPNPVLAMIEAVTDVEALKRLYAENQAAFSDEAVMAAWKTKGKALTVAAA